jgi:hypothetical protein
MINYNIFSHPFRSVQSPALRKLKTTVQSKAGQMRILIMLACIKRRCTMKRMSILQLLLPAAIQLLGSRMKRAGEGTRAWLIYPVESSTTKTGGDHFVYQ